MMDTKFCMDCVMQAIARHGFPAILDADCGARYKNKEFIAMIECYGIRISMEGIGRCLDNIFVEQTLRTLKYECIFLHYYDTMTQLSNGLEAFIALFINERLHQGLEYQIPNEEHELGCFPIRENDIQVA